MAVMTRDSRKHNPFFSVSALAYRDFGSVFAANMEEEFSTSRKVRVPNAGPTPGMRESRAVFACVLFIVGLIEEDVLSSDVVPIPN